MTASHIFNLRVYYEDTDLAGIVYYANYLKFIERARTEMLRAEGLEQERFRRETGLVFAVRRCAIDYLRAAKLDDWLRVETTVARVRHASLTLRQQVARVDETDAVEKTNGADETDGAPAVALAAADVELACLDRDLSPARLPPALKTRLLEMV